MFTRSVSWKNDDKQEAVRFHPMFFFHYLKLEGWLSYSIMYAGGLCAHLVMKVYAGSYRCDYCVTTVQHIPARHDQAAVTSQNPESWPRKFDLWLDRIITHFPLFPYVHMTDPKSGNVLIFAKYCTLHRFFFLFHTFRSKFSCQTQLVRSNETRWHLNDM